MLKSWINFALILLMISTVVLNQRDYPNYYDYYGDEYPGLEERRRLTPSRFRVAQFSAADSGSAPEERAFWSKPGKAEDIGLVNSVLGIVAGGKCLIKCVLSVPKICFKVMDCIANCIMPGELKTLTRATKKYDDDDIKPKGRYSHSSDMTPGDVVKLFDCVHQCLVRYLPRSLDTLTDWLTCITKKCICQG